MVGSWDLTLFTPDHCTVEQGRKFVPVTFTVSAALPAGAEVCESVAIVGVSSAVVGVVTVNGRDPEEPSEFVTVTFTVPANAATVAGIAAVSCVALTKVVVLCAVPSYHRIAGEIRAVHRERKSLGAARGSRGR